MKLTTTTFISLDGVVQGPGGADEDTRGGFDRGGWVASYFDDEGGAYVVETINRADAFLFGRWTYDMFADYWGVKLKDSDNPIAQAFNAKPKYLASTTTTDPAWEGTTLLTGDTADAIRELKAQDGVELQVHGSCSFVSWLIENELVDEVNMLTMPVVVGQGKRLFPDGGLDVTFEVVDSKVTPAGVSIITYKPAGRPEYGVAGEEMD